MPNKEPKEPIRVVDRRSFTPDGKPRERSVEATPAPAGAPEPPEVVGKGFTMREAADGGAMGEDPSFLGLLVSIYQNGLICLGEPAEEGEPPGPVDLDGVRGAVEMLSSIRRKTKGNLTLEESHIIDDFIAQLQMRYAVRAPRS